MADQGGSDSLNSQVEDVSSNKGHLPDSLQRVTNSAPTIPRAELVDLAVKFLTNPRVSDSPLDQKKTFLEKKGLTNAEIDEALKLAGPQIHNHFVNESFSGQTPPLPTRPLNPPSTSTWREYVAMTVVVSGVGYVIYYFTKKYIIPWFSQSGTQEQRLNAIQSSVEQLHTNVSETVASINESTQSLRDLLSEQQQHLQLLTSQVTALQTLVSQTGSGQSLREIKEEVGTLKGLLLNRHQFPPTPSRHNNVASVGIPQWQRTLAQATPTKSDPINESCSNGSSPDTNTSEQKTNTPHNGEVEELVTLPVVESGAVKENMGENSD